MIDARAVSAVTAAAVLVVAAPGHLAPPRLDGLVGPTSSRAGRVDRGVRSAGVLVATVESVVTAVGRRARRLAHRPPSPPLDRRVGAVLLVGLAVAPVHPVAAVLAMVAVRVGPALVGRSRRRQRREQFLDDVPDVIELFRLAIGAGLTIHHAVEAVGARAPGDLSAVLARVRSEVAVGHRLADALDRVGTADDALRPLTSALAGAERYGAPVGPTLDRLADDTRLQRRRRAEEVARRLPVQMLFPLVLCILPAFALLTVVPLVLAALDGLPR